jgi:hypothetical protein
MQPIFSQLLTTFVPPLGALVHPESAKVAEVCNIKPAVAGCQDKVTYPGAAGLMVSIGGSGVKRSANLSLSL